MKYLILLFFSICSMAQQTSYVDFINCKASVIPNFENKTIEGKVYYEFKVLSDIDSIRIDARNMDFSEVLINGKLVHFKNNKKELILFEGFAKGDNSISFIYKAFPKQALYFIGTSESHQIWTQGQGKYTSNWLPSFDDVNEKVVFNISVTYNNDYQVVSNGVLRNKKNNLQGKTTFYEFEMEKPMSSYLVMLAIGKFNYQIEKSKTGVPVEKYFKPQDSLKVEPTYRYSAKIFNFLEKEIGVKYPWKIYRQIPVNDFVYAGMENTTSTIFAQEYVVDEMGFNDRNYINVNAHELAHQWFGDLITAKSGTHHWLQEGFATYYALLAEKEVFGEDYFYNKLYDNWLQIKIQSQQKGVLPILNEKASSLSFYEKGAWALHSIRTDIGERKFKKAVKNYVKKYSFKNVETDDFLAEIKKVSNFDTENFKKKWLESTNCDSLANPYLKKWKQYQYLERLYRFKASNNKDSIVAIILKNKNIHSAIKVKALQEIPDRRFDKDEKELNSVFYDKNIDVQQMILRRISSYSDDYQSKMDSIFNLPSYDIKRDFINNIKMSENQRKKKLLEIEELSKKNYELRLTWLQCALIYNDFQPEKHQQFIDEMNNYTSSNYDIYTRITAFFSMQLLDPINSVGLNNLFLATKHHNWHLVSSAKQLIESYLKYAPRRNIIIEFKKTALPEVQDIIQKYLDKYKVGDQIND